MTGKILGREMKLRMKMKMMKMIIFLIDVDSRGDAAPKDTVSASTFHLLLENR